ncbi:MAG: DUF4255 domain-containing protein [Ignavibacteria bacterium]|nr:DUF4255 domain-containing protein [Ignavibacteria bacterium]
MIDISFNFVMNEINEYLNAKLNPTPKNIVILADAVKIADSANQENNIFLSLINIEEDRISRNPENFVKVDNRVVYKNPKVNLNLYCIFVINKKDDYFGALRQLSSVIQFFQFKNVFTHENSPSLDPGIDKIIFDLHSLNFEQLNHLWGVLGGKYLPSVMYKMRMITIDENMPESEGELIKTIKLEGQNYSH